MQLSCIIYHHYYSRSTTGHGGAWAERRYSFYSFSTSTLDGGERSASRPGRAFGSGERTPGTHCTGGWVGPRAGLDTEATGKILSRLPGIEALSPGRPARSQTLYWLSYPAHIIITKALIIFVIFIDGVGTVLSFRMLFGKRKFPFPFHKIFKMKESERNWMMKTGVVHAFFSLSSCWCSAIEFIK
jgi:hypothetical protein